MASRRKLRVFLDSNVIFSGLHSSRGAPGAIVEHFIKGNIGVVVSQQVLEEVIRVIKEKLPDALPDLRRLLMSMPPEVTADPSLEDTKRWEGNVPVGDAAILAAAVAAQPDHFITGDNHFLRSPGIAEGTGLRIATPAQFLELLKHGRLLTVS